MSESIFFKYKDKIHNNQQIKVVKNIRYGSFMGFNLILLMILIGIVIGSLVVSFGKGSAKNIGFIFYRL